MLYEILESPESLAESRAEDVGKDLTKDKMPGS